MRGFALWFGLFGGMAMWIVHLGGSYAAVPWVCGTGRVWVLHLITAGTALVAGAATAAGVLRMRAVARRNPGASDVDGASAWSDDPPRALRTEGFLALSGILMSGFFLALILFEGLPLLFQADPCAAVPLREGPIIRGDPPAPSWLAVAVHDRGMVGPDGAWSTWNLDPWILGALYASTLAYLLGVRRLWASAGRGRGIPRWRVGAFLGGIAALLLALVSPIDPLGGTLFSVHMVQHMLLMVVAAPLLVLGRPLLGALWALPRGGRRAVGAWWQRSRAVRFGWPAVSHPVVVIVLHVGALWLWHVPELYQAALAHGWVHHLEHASFFFTAMLFWWALAEAGARGRWPGYGAGVLYVFATALQSGALGALLLFARDPWYPAHEAGAAAWGVDLLVDQQLAGALMWIPAGLVYTAAAVVLLLAWIERGERALARRERAGWAALHPRQG